MPKPKATQVGEALRACLEEIRPDNGYFTAVAAVYGPLQRVPDKAPTPYIIARPVNDVRTSTADVQATRARTFELECVFSKASEEADIDGMQTDVLRALGFGQDQPQRKFPGLIDDQDEAEFDYASSGATTHSITLTIGVIYVETYN